MNWRSFPPRTPACAGRCGNVTSVRFETDCRHGPDRRDRFHSWALDAFTRFAPFFTCDAVLVESASFFPTPNPVLTLVERGDLVLDAGFVLSHELSAVRALTAKYADAPMDLADACIVRMAGLSREGRVWTVDRADFSTYRRNGRDSIPCEFPPSEE